MDLTTKDSCLRLLKKDPEEQIPFQILTINYFSKITTSLTMKDSKFKMELM